ncbi:MAG: hypothetical protein K2H29_09805 [Oscillospiraceae bacterium]|nr:hypothetical protein [Oscillospiraceae bacterium]
MQKDMMLADTTFNLFMNLSRVVEKNYDQAEQNVHSQIDSKLRQMIHRKKIELGIKDEYTQNY